MNVSDEYQQGNYHGYWSQAQYAQSLLNQQSSSPIGVLRGSGIGLNGFFNGYQQAMNFANCGPYESRQMNEKLNRAKHWLNNESPRWRKAA